MQPFLPDLLRKARVFSDLLAYSPYHVKVLCYRKGSKMSGEEAVPTALTGRYFPTTIWGEAFLLIQKLYRVLRILRKNNGQRIRDQGAALWSEARCRHCVCSWPLRSQRIYLDGSPKQEHPVASGSAPDGRS